MKQWAEWDKINALEGLKSGRAAIRIPKIPFPAPIHRNNLMFMVNQKMAPPEMVPKRHHGSKSSSRKKGVVLFFFVL